MFAFVYKRDNPVTEGEHLSFDNNGEYELLRCQTRQKMLFLTSYSSATFGTDAVPIMSMVLQLCGGEMRYRLVDRKVRVYCNNILLTHYDQSWVADTLNVGPDCPLDERARMHNLHPRVYATLLIARDEILLKGA